MTSNQSAKKAILVVSFGTSHHDACEKNIKSIEKDIAAEFPQWEIRRAFTSGMIIRKLSSRDGISTDTVVEALERLHSEGFDTVVIQPTHILNGEEYDDIVEDAGEYVDRFRNFVIGDPLLTNTDDYKQLVKIVSDSIPAESSTAICLMGHGSEHFADSAYAALDYHFKDNGRADICVGTVEGFPDLDTLMRHVEALGVKRVLLTPLMVVAGDHAVNDMAGDEEDSWKIAFTAAGYETDCLIKGLGEYAEIRKMYIEHVRSAVNTVISMSN